MSKWPDALPRDAVPLSSFDTRTDHKRGTQSLEYRQVLSAIKSKAVRGITFGGQFFVSKAEADAYLMQQTRACSRSRPSRRSRDEGRLERKVDRCMQVMQRIARELGISIEE